MNEPFPYSGDESLRPAIEQALARVIDPEMGLDILAIGLVYGVDATRERVKIRLTMTSAACPMGELIVSDIEDALREALGPVVTEVEMCWDPPWGPERMSRAAREAMGWE
ncbi:MAG TPA: metal-sulfur cluster assembly factor [Usitatibacter sp.]|nr:metal-sulfur cluster assembly factor [Usitatibacter sp.]